MRFAAAIIREVFELERRASIAQVQAGSNVGEQVCTRATASTSCDEMPAILAQSLAIASLVWHPVVSPAVVTDSLAARPALAVAETPANIVHLRSDWHSWDPGLLCTVIVHEVGHTTGHHHSSDPRNVMYRRVERVYWRCRRAGFVGLDDGS